MANIKRDSIYMTREHIQAVLGPMHQYHKVTCMYMKRDLYSTYERKHSTMPCDLYTNEKM